jgi:hypothetical protein
MKGECYVPLPEPVKTTRLAAAASDVVDATARGERSRRRTGTLRQ